MALLVEVVVVRALTREADLLSVCERLVCVGKTMMVFLLVASVLKASVETWL